MSSKKLDGYKYQCGYLTWVSSTATALNGMGKSCEPAELAALSGYAFLLNIHPTLCPSGPTAFIWDTLEHSLRAYGFEVSSYCPSIWSTEKWSTKDYEAKHVFELVKSEIDKGRPAVIWGTHVPEFGVAVGYEDDHYHVESFKSKIEPKIKFDSLQAPGGFYAMFFRPTIPVDKKIAEEEALYSALGIASGQFHFSSKNYKTGLEGYDEWIKSVKSGEADEFGHAYNTVCWLEARNFASDWLEKIAKNHPEVTDVLLQSSDYYQKTVDSLEKISELTPFPQGGLSEPGNREKVVDNLKMARDHEKKAVELLCVAVNTLGMPFKL